MYSTLYQSLIKLNGTFCSAQHQIRWSEMYLCVTSFFVVVVTVGIPDRKNLSEEGGTWAHTLR